MADNKNDDITDLTEDEESSQKPKQKGKKEKKEKAPALTPEEKKAAKEEKKAGKKAGTVKKKGGILKLLLILLPVIIVAAFVVALIFNLYNIRGIIGEYVNKPLISVITWFDPELHSVKKTIVQRGNEQREDLEAEYQARKGELDEREQDIIKREMELEGRITEATDREKQLDSRSKSLDRREANLNTTEVGDVPLYLRVWTDEELTAMQSISRTYSNMTPSVAAVILAELHEPDDAAMIIYHMSERGAAAIMEVMDSDLAARLTEILLYNRR